MERETDSQLLRSVLKCVIRDPDICRSDIAWRLSSREHTGEDVEAALDTLKRLRKVSYSGSGPMESYRVRLDF